MNDVPSPVPDPAPGASPPPIGRAIYGMPMFATLLVADIDRTTSWYAECATTVADASKGRFNTAWNTRDLRTVDPDGNVVVFTAPRPLEQPDRRVQRTGAPVERRAERPWQRPVIR